MFRVMLGGIGAAAAEGTLGIAAEHFGSFLGRKPGGSALFGFKIPGSGLAPLALPGAAASSCWCFP